MSEQPPRVTSTILPPISKTPQKPPFNISNDNEVFQMMTGGNESGENKHSKTAKIWQKTTANCRNQLKRFNNFYTPIDDKYVSANVYNARDKKMIEDAIEIINNRKKNKELGTKKEVIGEILEQKKEMFLVTMTHGIIESEIQNLKDQADQRKKALEESEELLKRDKHDFQTYQEKYKEDSKKAEDEFELQVQKRKLKEQDIKAKQIVVNSLRAEQARNQDNILAYQKYKVSLDQLLPKEWVEQKQKRRQARIVELRTQYYQRWLQQQFGELDSKEKTKLLQQKKDEYEKRFNQALADDEIQELDELENEQKMYFKQPQELIELFNGLEQDSLFCMQNARLALEAYQQLKVQYTDKKATLQTKFKYLLENKTMMDRQLTQIETQIRTLKKKKEQNNSNINEKDNKDIKSAIETEYLAMKEMMPSLMPEIQNNSASALTLLGGIETCMEKLLERLLEASIEHPKLIKQIRTNLEKKKNMQKREEVANFNKQQEQKRKLRNQNKKEPVAKSVGRLDMARSAPRDKLQTKKVVVQDNQSDQDKRFLIQ